MKRFKKGDCLHMKKATIIDVAKSAGVSIGTVSRVLNNKKVTPLTKEKVENAITHLNYHRNDAARNLRTNRSKAFAFIVSDISNVTFSTIAKSLSDVLDGFGYSLILYNIGTDNIESKLERFFAARSVDGAFLVIGEEKNTKIINILNDLDIPLLIFDRQIDCDAADFIFSDYYNGIRQATEHLISLGHESIGFITGSLDIYPAREGLRGYRDALKLNDTPMDESLIKTGSFTHEFGAKATESLISKIKNNEMTALITGGSPVLAGVLKTLQKDNIHLNRDLSIVSFEDTEITQIMSITAIRRPLHDVGAKTAYSLINRLRQNSQGNDNTSSLVLPTELIIRSSSGQNNTLAK